MIPQQVDFKDAYQNDGLRAKVLRFSNSSGVMDLSDYEVRLTLVDINNKIGWKFSSAGDGDSLISFDDEGSIILNQINEWNIKPGQYRYDLQIKDESGFVDTYLKGNWKIVSDITKSV